ncbi:hypothetical protein [Nostoc sp. NMS4]|nr:hypothetical protein [Nostoc sp. NMS4]MBN3927913.1 hypothetical protein [Nostoc sp. NMS4]
MIPAAGYAYALILDTCKIKLQAIAARLLWHYYLSNANGKSVIVSQ